MKVKVKAKGIVRHAFHGSYLGTLVLSFADAESAKGALVVLGNGF